MVQRVHPPRSRTAYAVASLALFGTWTFVALISIGLFSDNGRVAVAAVLIAAVVWNVLSLRRISDTRLVWLHAAPYVTIAGLYLLLFGAIVSRGNFSGDPRLDTPQWEIWLAYAGFPIFLTWPLATVALSLLRGRQ